MGNQACCRFCGTRLQDTFVDLGMSPLCESLLAAEQLNCMEPFYPLKVYVCGKCFLVQLEEYVSPQSIFTEYAYFSSFSTSWLQHAERYAELMVENFHLGARSQVVELGSNDGYLLQFFARRNIPVLGVDPAANVVAAAVDKGVRTITGFFGTKLARDLSGRGTTADLLIGNNVLAQVPDINDFVEGMRMLLSPDGVLTMEFPHLMRLIDGNQFDTIYHEHFSYFSLLCVEQVFAAHGIGLFDVEELKTHGGSLRIYGQLARSGSRALTGRVAELIGREIHAGYDKREAYSAFGGRVTETKRKLLKLLIEVKEKGKRIVGYGAPGKGNTLLNYCGIRSDFLDYTVDMNPYKHGRFTPGTHVRILPPEVIREDRPDYLFILPWNLKEEIMKQMAFIREWGGGFIVPIPEPELIRGL